jgi:hypothetical protein
MTTTVATASASAGALAALGNLKQGLQNVQSGIRVAGGEPILRMGRDGIWIYGADNVEVEGGSTWAINPMSLTHGFICWKVIPEGSKEKPELLGEETRSMFQPLPNKDSLPDYGHPWAEVLSVQLKCVSGEDEGGQVLYKTSSTGGLRAMKELITSITEAIDKHPETPVPVVALESDSYPHKQYGKTYFPVINIQSWVSMEGVATDTGMPVSEQQQTIADKTPAETAPKPARRAAAAAPAQQEPANDEDEDDETATVAAPVGGFTPGVDTGVPSAEGVRRRRRAA